MLYTPLLLNIHTQWNSGLCCGSSTLPIFSHSLKIYGVTFLCSLEKHIYLHFLGEFLLYLTLHYVKDIGRCGQQRTIYMGAYLILAKRVKVPTKLSLGAFCSVTSPQTKIKIASLRKLRGYRRWLHVFQTLNASNIDIINEMGWREKEGWWREWQLNRNQLWYHSSQNDNCACVISAALVVTDSWMWFTQLGRVRNGEK